MVEYEELISALADLTNTSLEAVTVTDFSVLIAASIRLGGGETPALFTPSKKEQFEQGLATTLGIDTNRLTTTITAAEPEPEPGLHFVVKVMNFASKMMNSVLFESDELCIKYDEFCQSPSRNPSSRCVLPKFHHG